MDEIQELQLKLENTQGIERVDILNDLAGLIYFNDSDGAKAYCDEALELAKKLDHKPGIGGSIFILGSIERVWGKPEDAIPILNQALEIQLKIGDKIPIYETYHSISIVHIRLGNYDNALKFDKLALEYLGENNHERRANVNNNAGIVNFYQGNYQISLDYYFKAHSNYLESGNRSAQANTLYNIALVHKELQNYFEAIKFQQESSKIHSEDGGVIYIAIQNTFLGEIYIEMGELEKAEDALEAAHETLDQIGQERYLANTKIYYSHLKFNQKAYAEAVTYAEDAFALNRELKVMVEMIQSQTILGRALFKVGETQKAEDHLKEALALALENEVPVSEMECHSALIELYAFKNQGEMINDHFQKYVGLKEAFSTEQFSKRMASKQVQFDTEKAQKEAEIERFRNVELAEAYDKAEAALKALSENEKKLQNRAVELEMFNKTMVEREMRIIEMKEEVNKLRKELGYEPAYPTIWQEDISE